MVAVVEQLPAMVIMVDLVVALHKNLLILGLEHLDKDMLVEMEKIQTGAVVEAVLPRLDPLALQQLLAVLAVLEKLHLFQVLP